MIKDKKVLEYKSNKEHVYEFVCAPDSPLGEIHDALCAFKSLIVQRINEEQEKEKQNPPPAQEA